MPKTTTENMVEEIMSKTKVEVLEKRAEVDSRLQRAFADGVLFTLHIGKKSWTIKPEPQDFGLTEFPAIFKPGRMLLLPEETLETINRLEGGARRFLDSKSFHFGESGRAGFRFVRVKMFGDVHLELENRRKEFFEAVDMLVSVYGDARATMEKMYFDHWERLKEQNPQVLAIQENYLKREAHWLRLANQYPEPSAIPSFYTFKFSFHQMSFPDQLEKVDFRSLVKEQEHDEEYFQKLEAALADGRRKIDDQVTQFVQETVRNLRGEVVGVFNDMLLKVREGKPLTKQNVGKLREILDYVKEMDFLNDAQFHEQLKTVSERLEGQTEFRDNDAVTQALTQALTGTIEFVSRTTETTVSELSDAYFSRKLVL